MSQPSDAASARLVVDPAFSVGPISRRVFGSFVEHLGRCVYDGIYEPDHPSADEDGFRTDVLELVRELGVSTVRYPGGNFVSGYRWEDGVGPREERPKRLDLAWHSLETNHVGLHEFAAWSAKAGCELMLAINLGTRGVLEALDLLEYTNIREGSTLADARVANGAKDPFGVKMWCLGNEMDGPWQLGHRDAEDYGKLASATARALRQMDPSVELVACGSSSRSMPTFGSWERTVLEHTYDDVDFISCHAYYHEADGDLASFLACGEDMRRFIESVVASADHVKAVRGSDKTINISFDEWNVWYIDRYHNDEQITDIETWPYAPRLLEDQYNLADAVVVGGLLICLLQHADRVTAASLAQLVNVIAPIMTEPGGPAWRQTTFYPFALTSRLAQGRALRVELASPSTPTAKFGEVSMVDAVATADEESGSSAVFLVNRSTDRSVMVSVDVTRLGGVEVKETHLMAGDDPHASNSRDATDSVTPREHTDLTLDDGTLTVLLPPASWSAISLGR